MYLIKYEKDNLKTHIIYNVLDEQVGFILSSDNGFQQGYLNYDSTIVRLHYKFITYNEELYSTVEIILEALNNYYKTSSEDWTITIKESMLDKKHIIQYYFYSNTYSIKLKDLKKSIKIVQYKNIHIDDSIYYVKYREFIKAEIPFQSDYSKKYNKHYKLFNGSIKNSLLTLVNNLKLFS
jgi:hypothetical protein